MCPCLAVWPCVLAAGLCAAVVLWFWLLLKKKPASAAVMGRDDDFGLSALLEVSMIHEHVFGRLAARWDVT